MNMTPITAVEMTEIATGFRLIVEFFCTRIFHFFFAIKKGFLIPGDEDTEETVVMSGKQEESAKALEM